MGLDNELIDKLLEAHQKPEALIGENGLKQLTKALVERGLHAELRRSNQQASAGDNSQL